MAKKRGDDTRLWQVGSFTPLPNDVLDWVLHEAKTVAEAEIVLFIARLSCGFNRLKTSWRLRRKDFVDELGINQRTVSRALARLLKTGRIYRSDPKMGYWYYSLYPSAKALVHAFQTGTPVAHTVTPVSQGRDTGGTHCDTCVTGEGHRWHTGHHELSRVNTLRAGRGTEHISSILQRIRPG